MDDKKTRFLRDRKEPAELILPETGPTAVRYARAVVGFTTRVIHTRSVEEVLWLLTDDVVVDLGFEDCVVYLLDEARSKLVQKAAFGNKKAGPETILEPIEIGLGEGITGRCALLQEPVLVNDLATDPDYLVDDLERRSELAVPIVSQGKTIGVIDSEHSERNFYTAQHLATLQALSAIITTKYENERALKGLEASQRRLQHLVNHDSLSGLPNRHCFLSELGSAVEHYLAGKLSSVAVLIMDLDRFKLVNDSYGHSAGDELIVGVGKRLRARIPDAHLLARLSGDEFAVLLSNFQSGDPERLCREVLAELEAPVSLNAADVRVSASIGVAEARSDRASASALMRLADGAMYKAKAHGKGCYFLSQSGLQVEALSDLNLEQAIATGLESGQFEVFLQPIVRFSDRQPVSFESLVRWNHPEIGIIQPSHFIDFAERSGQVRDIDLYMIRKVGRLLEMLEEKHETVTPIGVNVSASLLSRTDWLGRLDSRWFELGLQVEVTERALVADVSVASETLQSLREMGARIYIDDFGTGYSSLSYLHRLPLDAIKIDRSFVDSLVEDQKSRALVRGLVALGRGMGCDLVAEGIETEQQLEELRSLDVDCGQGYLFARPMPASDLLAYLQGRWLPEAD